MTDDLSALLLQALGTPGNGSDGSPNVEELLARLEHTDPLVGAVARHLVEQPVSEQETGSASDRPFRRELEETSMELEELRSRNDVLAAALGACYLCWGEDPDCERCAGAGQPGSGVPDHRLFTELVAPALARVGDVARQRHSVPTRNETTVTTSNETAAKEGGTSEQL
jgi:hypothetical protein